MMDISPRKLLTLRSTGKIPYSSKPPGISEWHNSENQFIVFRTYGKSIQRNHMMDVIMVAVLLVCFGSMKLFADWCEKQVKVQRVKEDEES